MNLTSDEWYSYGYRLGEISKYLDVIQCVFCSRYGWSNKYYSYCCRLKTLFNAISGILEVKIIDSYPPNMQLLQKYDIHITSVFYSLNRHSFDEFNDLYAPCKPFPKTLLPQHKVDFMNYSVIIKQYMDEITNVIFNHHSLLIKEFLKKLSQLDDFIINEAEYEEK